MSDTPKNRPDTLTKLGSPRAGTTVVGLLASIPPPTTPWFEHSTRRRGLIDGERARQG